MAEAFTEAVGDIADELECSWPAPHRLHQDLVDLEASLEAVRKEVVSSLRASGRSWAQVGAALGVTRQAAWKRYGPKAPR